MDETNEVLWKKKHIISLYLCNMLYMLYTYTIFFYIDDSCVCFSDAGIFFGGLAPRLIRFPFINLS